MPCHAVYPDNVYGLSDSTMLLIGAHGFVGRHMYEAATSAGLDVITTDRDGSRGLDCDLLDPVSVAACISNTRPGRIVNMAGAASVAASWEDPAAALAINATGVLHLLEAVARHAPEAHVLCASSGEVYGEAGEGGPPFVEARQPAPVTPYGASKAAMEVLCGQYARGQGLRIAIVRAFGLLGPGQLPDFTASGFARQIAVAEVAGAERVELAVGNLTAARDFTDVRDAARAFLDVSRRELTGTFNLCSGKATKLEDLVAKMAKATPLPVEVVAEPSLARPADPSTVYGDPARLREATGWEPRIPLAQTVADLLDWWRAELGGAPSISSP
ncbi:MAG TPA: GDP-mannose 4,6-dehydratase [Solirubrobacterales bacterium]|nr:GDP-mannose 4,6-dehydratase [Solirubrobacterales bacterium]